MAMIPKLEMRQGQALVMTPQLQQAIKLLQMSNLDLQAFVDAELERNPLIERDEEVQAPQQEAAANTALARAHAAAEPVSEALAGGTDIAGNGPAGSADEATTAVPGTAEFRLGRPFAGNRRLVQPGERLQSPFEPGKRSDLA